MNGSKLRGAGGDHVTTDLFVCAITASPLLPERAKERDGNEEGPDPIQQGDGGGVVASEEDRLARRQPVRPVPGTDIATSSWLEVAGWCEESVHRPNRNPPGVPAQDERLIVGVAESAAAAYRSGDVRGEG